MRFQVEATKWPRSNINHALYKVIQNLQLNKQINKYISQNIH